MSESLVFERRLREAEQERNEARKEQGLLVEANRNAAETINILRTRLSRLEAAVRKAPCPKNGGWSWEGCEKVGHDGGCWKRTALDEKPGRSQEPGDNWHAIAQGPARNVDAYQRAMIPAGCAWRIQRTPIPPSDRAAARGSNDESLCASDSSVTSGEPTPPDDEPIPMRAVSCPGPTIDGKCGWRYEDIRRDEPTPPDDEARARTLAEQMAYGVVGPTIQSYTLALLDYAATVRAETEKSVREECASWFCARLEWNGDGYSWCPTDNDNYREDPRCYFNRAIRAGGKVNSENRN